MKRVARRFGFKEVSEDDDWNLYWTDYSVALERVMDMKRYQVNDKYFLNQSDIVFADALCIWHTRDICERYM